MRAPSWTRLEPQSVTGDPRPGLEARVHDPLWLLCRQWQLGELEGDDAGSPLGVELSVSSSQFARWQAGDWELAQPKPVLNLPDGALLEPVVESETGTRAGPGLRDRAAAGAVFLARVEQAGFDALREPILTHVAVSGEPAPDEFDRSWPVLVNLLAGRTVDADRLAVALDEAADQPDGLPQWLAPVASRPPECARPDRGHLARLVCRDRAAGGSGHRCLGRRPARVSLQRRCADSGGRGRPAGTGVRRR